MPLLTCIFTLIFRNKINHQLPALWRILIGGLVVSIVRIGLAETKNFAEGYEAIFGGKKASATKMAPKKTKKIASKKPKGKGLAKKKAGKKK